MNLNLSKTQLERLADTSSDSAVKFRGHLAAKLGAMLADATSSAKITPYDIKFTFLPSALRSRPATDADIAMEGCGLVVLDFKQLTGEQPACPICGSNSNVIVHGWAENAHSCLGNGPHHTWYIISKKRLCKQGMLPQLCQQC